MIPAAPELLELKEGRKMARTKEQGQSSVWPRVRGQRLGSVRLEVREGWGLRSGLVGTGCLCREGERLAVPKASS